MDDLITKSNRPVTTGWEKPNRCKNCGKKFDQSWDIPIGLVFKRTGKGKECKGKVCPYCHGKKIFQASEIEKNSLKEFADDLRRELGLKTETSIREVN